MKKTPVLLMVVCLALATVSSQAQQKQLSIAFLRAGPDPYYQYGMDAAAKAAKLLNVNLVTYTSNNSPSQELSNIQDAITKGADGILMYGVSLSSEKASIERANRAKVPIFLQYGYDRTLLTKAAGFMQIDLFEFGKPLGQWAAKNVPSGEVAIIEGLLGRGDAETYTSGFLAGMKSNPKLQVVAQVAADWNRQKAMTAAQQILTAHPNLAVMFVQNDDMAVGASLAIDRAGLSKQIALISMNGAPYGLDLITQGKLRVTNANPPSIASVMALRLLVNVVNGKTPSWRFYPAPTQLIEATNVSSATRWSASDQDVAAWMKLPLPKAVAAPK